MAAYSVLLHTAPDLGLVPRSLLCLTNSLAWITTVRCARCGIESARVQVNTGTALTKSDYVIWALNSALVASAAFAVNEP